MEWGRARFHAVRPIEQMEDRPRRRIPPNPTPWFNEGKRGQRVAFAFAAPGRHEADWQMPAAGDTGLALNMLLAFLHEAKPRLFRDLERYSYRIVNSSKEVHYEALDDMTTPFIDEIETNSEVFKDKLAGSEIVLSMGGDAWRACRKAFAFPARLQHPEQDEHEVHFPFARVGQTVFIKAPHLSGKVQTLGGLLTTERILPKVMAFGCSNDDSASRSKYRIMVIARAIVAALDMAGFQ